MLVGYVGIGSPIVFPPISVEQVPEAVRRPTSSSTVRAEPSSAGSMTSRSGDQSFHSPQIAAWLAPTAPARVKVTVAVPFAPLDLIIVPPQLVDPWRRQSRVAGNALRHAGRARSPVISTSCLGSVERWVSRADRGAKGTICTFMTSGYRSPLGWPGGSSITGLPPRGRQEVGVDLGTRRPRPPSDCSDWRDRLPTPSPQPEVPRWSEADLLAVAVIVAAEDGSAGFANRAWTAMTGQCESDWVGQGWFAVLDEACRPTERAPPSSRPSGGAAVMRRTGPSTGTDWPLVSFT